MARTPFCFSVKGNSGRLVADMTVDGTETSYDIAPNTWTAVGESADPEIGSRPSSSSRVTVAEWSATPGPACRPISPMPLA
ncbi:MULTISPECIES: hypothetical protein [Streptomyces]|uniref:hypothetical protein n=1 Tax=Streptomyces TaxID=1883 RepID=UPI0015D9DE27|nr:hypothetical protein [Streptomyces sp. Z423-1]